MLKIRKLSPSSERAFTLIETLVVVAILLIFVALAMPRVGNAWVELRLISEARHAHALAQATRQYAIMRGATAQISFANLTNQPAAILVTDHSGTLPVPVFETHMLPIGFRFVYVGHQPKIVAFNSRGEADWPFTSSNAPYRVILRAPNGQERHLLFHRAGRIMLQKPQ